MSERVDNFILDLIEWVGTKEHTYQETLDVWRTSCSRLTVWEDATDKGLVETVDATGTVLVSVTRSASALLREKRARRC